MRDGVRLWWILAGLLALIALVIVSVPLILRLLRPDRQARVPVDCASPVGQASGACPTQAAAESPTASAPATALPTAAENAPAATAATGAPTAAGTTVAPLAGVYLSGAEIAAIRARAESGGEPWAGAYRRLLADADKALSAGPFTVTANGGPNGGHDYFTEKPYCGWTKVDGKGPDCRDGQINPQADRRDYQQAIDVAHAARDLGLAYALTGEDRYAEHAAALIRAWALDPATAMTPKLPAEQTIEIFITMPGLIYGADLIGNYGGWRPDEQRAFQAWARDLARNAASGRSSNNFENWRIVLMASAGVYAGDQALIDDAFGRFRAIIPEQMNESCELVRETGRADSLTYSLYALNAMTQAAEIARHQGVDLYGYSVDGKGLKCALDEHARFALRPERWPHRQNKPLRATDNLALFELAYAHYHDPAYLAVIERWGRPMTEVRTLGPVTLTHGSAAEHS